MQQTAKSDQQPNVQGFERFASVAGGLVMVGKGIRRGGFLGLVELAVGGLVLARGASGQCELKRAMADLEAKETGQASDKERYSHMPMDSEVHSPDFEDDAVTMPDTTRMGNETRADQQSAKAPAQGDKGAS
ncbi:hypothetical protein [Halopseudomonas sp.]|uniref:hypothetical protein n=1 Tax=Halopseudomonas sp. TaxID=2901191 RepID=UPI001A5A1062|nr:hypothetical protein [Pseudomonas sp.]|tara:strand:- start:4429 stop:4824 length:396 start_codon:yes stop_codon:yes gene_type:complete